MDLQTLRRLYEQCRDESLAPDDPRNVDLDHHDDEAVRGVSWVERLAAPIELSKVPVRQLITGLPGSGKSTELRRLEQRLIGHGYLVARIDAEDALDLTQPLDLPDVIAVVVDGAERAVRRVEGRGEEPEEEGYLARLWAWMKTTEAELGGVEVDAGPAKLTLEMKVRPDFRKQVRAALTRHFTRFLSDARSELESFDARSRAIGRGGLCIILDSLEKLRGLRKTWLEVLDSAERVFGGGAPYLKLPVHCLYTVPLALMPRLNEEIELMPMIKLSDRSGVRFAAGHEALRELVRCRITDSELEQILGPRFEKRIGLLIERSGGCPREIVWALRSLLELPEHPATDDDLERLRYETRTRFRFLITAEDVPWLVWVAREGALGLQTETDRRRADWALQNNIVQRHLNSETWYDLHPAVREIPAVARAIRQMET